MATAQLDTVIRHLRRIVLRQNAASRTDGQLLASFIKQKDEAAFEALVRRHGPMVFGVCRRVVRNHHDAEDAFQATFLVLARKASSVRPRERVANWLHGVALRTAMKAKTMTAKRRGREKQVTEVPETAAAQQGQWRDLQPLIDQELNGLPENYRLPILLCDLEGKTIKDAAQQLGWPQGSLAGRLARGRKLLAKRLASRGVVLSAGSLAAVVSQNVASAGVPTSLMSSTVKAAAMIAAGQATVAGAVPAKVGALTEGVLKSMMLTKLSKAAVAGLVVLCLCGLGVGGFQASSAQETKTTITTTTTTTITTTTTGQETEATSANLKEVFRKGWSDREVTSGVDLSPDGRLLISMHWGGMRVWEVASGKVIHEWPGWLGVFTPDGKQIVRTTLPDEKRNQLALHDAGSGKLLRHFGPHPHGLWALSMCPNGTTVVTGGDGNDPVSRLWDLETGELLVTSQSGRDSLSISAKTWDGLSVPELQERTGVVFDYVLPGGSEIMGRKLVEDRFVAVYDISSGKLVRKIPLADSGKVEVIGNAGAYGRRFGKRMAFSLADNTIVVLDLVAGKEVARFPSGLMQPKCLAISADDRFVAACASNEKSKVVVWRLPDEPKVTAKRVKATEAAEEEQEVVTVKTTAKTDVKSVLGNAQHLYGANDFQIKLVFTGNKVVDFRKAGNFTDLPVKIRLLNVTDNEEKFSSRDFDFALLDEQGEVVRGHLTRIMDKENTRAVKHWEVLLKGKEVVDDPHLGLFRKYGYGSLLKTGRYTLVCAVRGQFATISFNIVTKKAAVSTFGLTCSARPPSPPARSERGVWVSSLA